MNTIDPDNDDTEALHVEEDTNSTADKPTELETEQEVTVGGDDPPLGY